jgi:hypothetical protein
MRLNLWDSSAENLILNRSVNGSVMQALIILRFAVYGGFRIMLTHKDAKTMARSLRDSLANRNVLFSHSDCLEIVARQFGLADWNTLSAKLSNEQAPMPAPQGPDTALPREVSLSKVETPLKNDELTPAAQAAPPWGPCSFCGKSHPEVRICLGGCGGWEGFRARRNPESGERSNVFICNECIALCARIVAGNVGIAT